MNPTDQPEEKPLPSVEDVARFAEHWRNQIPAASGDAVSFTAQADNFNRKGRWFFTAYNSRAGYSGEGKTPEEAIESVRERLAPESVKARIASLREDADSMLKQAEELETAARGMEVKHV